MKNVLFNCNFWIGKTVIQGSDGFFEFLSDLLDSVCEYKNLSDDDFDRIYDITIGTPSNTIYNILNDIEKSNEDKKFYTSDPKNDWIYIKHNHHRQMIISEQLAIEIGFRIRAALKKMNLPSSDWSIQHRAMFAFSHIVQIIAMNGTPIKVGNEWKNKEDIANILKNMPHEKFKANKAKKGVLREGGVA